MVAKSVVPVALPKKRLVLEAIVEKKLVVVASVNKPLVKVPSAEKKETDDVAFKVLNRVEEAVVAKKEVEVAPVLVSMEKTEVEAEFSTSRAKPLIGVWMVVVPP